MQNIEGSVTELLWCDVTALIQRPERCMVAVVVDIT
jgi:hypothetical protein